MLGRAHSSIRHRRPALLSAVMIGLAGSGACGARSDLEALIEVEQPCSSTRIERCDGIDNDCDGAIDEDIAPVQCGGLGCVTTVVCQEGVMAPCVPREPTAEVCNFIDDDCDGEVDEGFGLGPLAEAVTLRTDEFSTGDCTSCFWAFGTTLAPTDNGYLALWELGLSGGRRQPNLYGRRLDAGGNPLGPIELLRRDFVLTMDPVLALDPLPDRGLPIDATYRIGSGDVPGLLFVDVQGETETVAPTPASGAYNVARMVWTGSRFVAAWEVDYQLRVAVLDANGALEAGREIEAGKADSSTSVNGLNVWQRLEGAGCAGGPDVASGIACVFSRAPGRGDASGMEVGRGAPLARPG